MPSAQLPRKLLVLDTAFTLEGIRERQVEHSVTCRDLGGFFEHVWSVHPFATLGAGSAADSRYGPPQVFELAQRHTLIEGKVGRFAWLNWAFPLNFLIGQIDLWLRLQRLVRREKISAIRVGSPLYLGLFGLALARFARVPLVIRVGANNDKYFETTGRPVEPRLTRSRRIEKLIERFVFPRADLVAGANQDNLDFALQNGARPERSTIFRYGNLVDPRHFLDPNKRGRTALDDLGVEPGKFLLYVGRLEPIKHPDDVVEVLAGVRNRGFEVRAVLAGEGTMHDALAERVDRLGLSSEVMFPGNLGQEQLAQLFPLAAAIVSPHTGRALAEAALGEAPVAAYDVDWQGELIATGVTGVLVPHGDVQAMTNAVADLLADPVRAKALGKAVRVRALEMFEPQVLDEHERREYRKLLDRWGNRRS